MCKMLQTGPFLIHIFLEREREGGSGGPGGKREEKREIQDGTMPKRALILQP